MHEDKLNEDELQTLAVHVVYELRMFRDCLDRRQQYGDCFWPGNAIQESLLLHFRNLREFFLVTNKKFDEDLVARDYLPQWKPKCFQVMEETKDDINKRLAHLSRLRRDSMKDDWPWNKMAEAIESLWLDFMQQLAPQRRNWFERHLRSNKNLSGLL